MKTAAQLLQTYLDNIRNPAAAAAVFAADGVLELPWVKAHAQGPGRHRATGGGHPGQGARVQLQERPGLD